MTNACSSTSAPRRPAPPSSRTSCSRNRAALRERGILYPADRHDAHFLAALDLMELPWGGLEREAVGAWDRLAAEVRAWPETAIISHEIFGTASRVQVARAMESLGGPDTEIHIVFSARDLVRQIPAEWQENVKHRRTKTYGRFLENLRDPDRSAEVAQWFWGVQEIPDVLDRWGETSRASRSTSSRSRDRARAPRCCGSASPGCSASTRPSSPRRTRPTRRSAYPSRR